MTAKLAFFKRISALEALPTTQAPLRIRGGLPQDPYQAFRATLRLPDGHIVYCARDPNESFAALIARIHRPGAVICIGGMPPLPGVDVTLGSTTDRSNRTDLLLAEPVVCAEHVEIPPPGGDSHAPG